VARFFKIREEALHEAQNAKSLVIAFDEEDEFPHIERLK
jgi:hypothetical protein